MARTKGAKNKEPRKQTFRSEAFIEDMMMKLPYLSLHELVGIRLKIDTLIDQTKKDKITALIEQKTKLEEELRTLETL